MLQSIPSRKTNEQKKKTLYSWPTFLFCTCCFLFTPVTPEFWFNTNTPNGNQILCGVPQTCEIMCWYLFSRSHHNSVNFLKLMHKQKWLAIKLDADTWPGFKILMMKFWPFAHLLQNSKSLGFYFNFCVVSSFFP